MEENEVESIADSLTAAFHEHTESDTESEEVQAVSERAAQETEAEDEVEVKAEAEEQAEVEEDSEDSEEPEKVFQAPEHWSSDERKSFDALPPEAQEVLLARDKAFQKGYQEKAQGIAAINEALEPWKDALAQRGVTPEQAIRTLFAAQHSLDANPVQGILQIAQSYGVTDQLREKFAPQTDDEDFSDPEIKALKSTISDLRNELTSFKQGQQQQTMQSLQRQIDDFKSAKSETGEPLYPHFDQLRTRMAPLVQDGKSLKEAYEEAVWTIPEYREAQLKAQREQKRQQSDLEKAEKVKKAKKAARSVRANGKADPSEGNEALSLHDTLTEAFRQHSA